MTRTRHPAVELAAAARHVSMVDTLNPLAEEVGRAVAAKVRDIGRAVSGRTKTGASTTNVTVELEQLEVHIKAAVARALGSSLKSPTAQGKALRMALIAQLASAELGGEAVDAKQTKTSRVNDAQLTTAEAAARLEVSRPYVSMLCDAGKLGEIVVTEGGHRRIRSSAVDAYLAARTQQTERAESPREAGVKAGLYDHPEAHFENRIRGAAVSQRGGASTKAKAASKTRS